MMGFSCSPWVPFRSVASFLSWVLDAWQQNMKCNSHRGAVLLHYNGIVREEPDVLAIVHVLFDKSRRQ